MPNRGPVTQKWVHGLTFMQQSVLLAAIRGPDGIKKDHIAKLLCRWLRRCILLSAFEGRTIATPYELGGGSFTGPSMSSAFDPSQRSWQTFMHQVVKDVLSTTDELPHHFTLHLMHAAEILGYKHPDLTIRAWWNKTYLMFVNDMHLFPESEELMDKRLGDTEKDWRAREEVTAKGPTP